MNSPASAPPPAPDALVARHGLLRTTVDGGAVVVDIVRGRAHRLNVSAAAVLDELDGTRSLDDVARALAARFDADEAAVRSDVTSAVALLRQAELLRPFDELEDGESADDAPGDPTGILDAPATDGPGATEPGSDEPATDGPGATEPGSDEPGGPGAAAVGTSSWTAVFLTTPVRFTCTDERVAAALGRLLAPLAVHGRDVPGDDDDGDGGDGGPVSGVERGPVRDVELLECGSAVELRADGIVRARRRVWPQLLAPVIVDLNRIAAHPRGRMLTLHAAGVAVDGRAVLLPAEPDAGKSTLVTALVAGGATYLSDEVLGLVATGPTAGPATGTTASPTAGPGSKPGQQPDTGLAVIGHPKAIALDRGSWPLFADLPAEARVDDELLGIRHQWLVDPRRLRGGAVAPGVALPVAAVVLPRHTPGGVTGPPDRLTPDEALLALLANTFNLADQGQAGLDLLVRLVTTVPVHRLAVDDLDEAVATVHALARAAPG